MYVLQLLAVELLNVLHRLLLTRDPPSVQLQVTAVVQETLRSAHEHLEQLRSSESEFIPHVFMASRRMTSRSVTSCVIVCCCVSSRAIKYLPVASRFITWHNDIRYRPVHVTGHTARLAWFTRHRQL